MMASSVWSTYESLFRHNEWNIGLAHERIDNFLKSDKKPKVEWLSLTEHGKCYSDPFAVVKDDVTYIFCEEFDYLTRKGRICCIEHMGDRYFSKPNVAIELPVHASYPYLIEDRGEIYCVPETYHAREITLYRARDFPYRWEKLSTLVNNFAGVDPTVFQFEGLWWLACTNQDVGAHDHLFIWYAHDLLAPWKPHASNPVKVALDSSRPAGRPFCFDGNFYRPAQDCSITYGKRIVVNKILTLTPSNFKEEPVAIIEPYAEGPYPDGIHTISSAGQVTLLDGKRIRFIGDAFKSEIMRQFNRVANKANGPVADSRRNHPR